MSRAGEGPGTPERSGVHRLSSSLRRSALHELEERFEILGELGRGGMGMVLRARERESERVVALKLLLDNTSAHRRERFLREGTSAAHLNHPGVVRVHSGGEVGEGVPYLVYELVEGARELDEVWSGLDLVARLRLLLEVARALEHAHAQGVVHRDLKPANVLVDAAGRARVTDFGLALDLGESERLTRTGAMLGTPFYMAPEQARARREEIGPASDVWSLGILLHEAVCGLPFEEGGSPLEALVRIQTGGVEPLRQRAPQVSARLEALAASALTLAPDERLADAGLFADELEACLREGEVYAARGLRPGQGAAALAGVALVAALAGLFVGLSPGPSAGEVSASPTTPPPAAQAQAPRLPPLPDLSREHRPSVQELAQAWEWLELAPDSHADAPRVRSLIRRSRRTPAARFAHGRITDARFVRGGLLTCGTDGTVRRWSLSGVEERRWTLQHPAHHMEVRPDGSWIAGTFWTEATRYDAESGRVQPARLGDVPLMRIRYALDGGLWVGTALGELLRLDARGKVLGRAPAHGGRVQGIVVLSDGGVLTFSGTTAARRSESLPIFARWSAVGVPRWKPELVNELESVSCSPDEARVALGHHNGVLALYDLPQERLLCALSAAELDDDVLPFSRAHRGAVVGSAFSPSGRVLYSAGGDRHGGEVRAWRLSADPSENAQLAIWGEGVRRLHLSLDPSGRWLVVVNQLGAELWPAWPD